MRLRTSHGLGRLRDPALIRRLLDAVEEEEETNCWLWRGYCDRKGYGQIWYAGRAHWAHRLSFAVFEGEIPSGMTIHHRCGCTSCVNPAHLSLVTRSWNSRDANRRRWSS